jgi:hypothetical protein
MRFAHVRVAAVTLLSGSFLTLGLLADAQAAPIATTANTDTMCQALPPPGTLTPSPDPSPVTSPPATQSSPAGDPTTASSPSPHATRSPGPTASPSPSRSARPSPSQEPSRTSSSPPGSGTSAAAGATAATLDAYLATSPSPSTSPSTSPSSNSPSADSSSPTADSSSPGSSSTSPPGPPELCVSVQRSQSSIKRGQTATYVVQISTQNGSASDVSVALTAQPSGQKPTFGSGCPSGNGTAVCGLNSVTTQPTSLKAQIAVASTAISVTSVKLTVTASVVTTATWTPPAAAMTTAVTAAGPSKSAKAKAKAKAKVKASPTTPNLAVLPLGPIPALNGEASLLIGAGNAAGLFPTISPSPAASPGPTPTATATAQPTKHKPAPVSEASPVSLGTPVFTAQVAGLIVLGLAIMLTVTRLSLRRRSGKPRS